MLYFGLHWSEQLRVAPAIVLTDEQERQLSRLARSKRTSVRLAQRAYGFLMAERLIADNKSVVGKKNFAARQVPALPANYIPRGSPARATARGALDHDVASPAELRAARSARAVPVLRSRSPKPSLVWSRDVARWQ
jgi:hypothetical protein